MIWNIVCVLACMCVCVFCLHMVLNWRVTGFLQTPVLYFYSSWRIGILAQVTFCGRFDHENAHHGEAARWKPLNKHRRAYSQQDMAIVSETEDIPPTLTHTPGVSFLFLQVRFKQKVETSKLWWNSRRVFSVVVGLSPQRPNYKWIGTFFSPPSQDENRAVPQLVEGSGSKSLSHRKSHVA